MLILKQVLQCFLKTAIERTGGGVSLAGHGGSSKTKVPPGELHFQVDIPCPFCLGVVGSLCEKVFTDRFLYPKETLQWSGWRGVSEAALYRGVNM